MPMYSIFKAILGNNPDIAKCTEKNIFRSEQLFFLSIFYPSGEPILQGGVGWRLHRRPFVVVHYNFMSYFFVAAAILARK
jgi:hypothetical protein